MRSNRCPKCEGAMSEGFMIEHDSSVRAVVKWVEGKPVKGLFGVKHRGRTQYETRTWRCSRCGFLESYAPE